MNILIRNLGLIEAEHFVMLVQEIIHFEITQNKIPKTY